MEQQSQIFRQAALEKLSSPEQLDQLMRVTSPKGWVALAACCAMLVTVLLWGIFGQIPTKVYGRGILLKRGGVFLVTARGEGHVRQIHVRMGQAVKEGDILATVNQPELKLKIEQGEIALAKLQNEKRDLAEFQEREEVLETKGLDQQRAAYNKMITDYGSQIDKLSERVATLQDRLKDLVAITQILEQQNNLYAVMHERMKAEIQVTQLTAYEIQAKERRRQQLQDLDNKIRSSQHEVDYLKKLFDLNTRIVSPQGGHVLEIMVKAGQLISVNTPILSLQEDTMELEARLFLSADSAKKVKPGLRVEISPTWVKKEEYGFMQGKVTGVSEFPATPQGMQLVLQNPALINEFSQGGTPFEVTAELLPDTNTFSGLRWSSAKGPRLAITSGTLCTCEIVVTNRRPISLVLPIVKESFGL